MNTKIDYISAGAGSGKTYKLTHELADRIERREILPEGVIMTTFTIKAAEELRERAKAVLYEKGLFDEAERLDQALIGTIHSIAYALRRKYWYYLGVSPELRVMTDEDKDFYSTQSLSQLPTDEEIMFLSDYRQYFDICKTSDMGSYKAVQDADFWRKDLLRVVEEAEKYEITDLRASRKHSLEVWSKICRPTPGAPAINNDLIRICLENTIARNDQDKPSDSQQKRKIKLSLLLHQLRYPNVKVYSDIESTLLSLPKKLQDDEVRDVLAMLGDLWDRPEVYEKQMGYIVLLFDLAERWMEQYRHFKREHNLLDFYDMEICLLELIDHEAAREALRESYSCLMVDEFQDSSPIQVRTFMELSELMTYNIWVGDGKQAIYGFRGTDTSLTNAVIDSLSSESSEGSLTILRKNYRSLPDIVNLCNGVFTPVFSSLMEEDKVRLSLGRPKDVSDPPLGYWLLDGSNIDTFLSLVAQSVLERVDNGVDPSSIAIIARNNNRLHTIAECLEETGIPINLERGDVSGTYVYMLITSLIQLVIDETDTLARAQIAYITEPNMGIKELIDSKLEYDDQECQEQWLSEVPLIKAVTAERSRLAHYSASALVESLSVEFCLRVRCAEYLQSSNGSAILDSVLQAARTYEERCLQLTLPSTLSGFLYYLESNPPILPGEKEGINLVTYHGSKGLEWDNVVLLDLDNDPINPNNLIQRSFFGIHAQRVAPPTGDNLFPEAQITALPWLFGPGYTVKAPEEYLRRIEPYLEALRQQELDEAKRLLYVGMTRAKNRLILAIRDKKKEPLKWLEQIGVSVNLENIGKADDIDLLGVGSLFRNLTPKIDDSDSDEGSQDSEKNVAEECHTYRYQSTKKYSPRDLSPSALEGFGKVTLLQRGRQRIPRQGKSDDAIVGNCLHQLFCRPDILRECDLSDLLSAYQLQGHLTDIESIRQSWSALEDFLRSSYGQAIAVRHEVPFKRRVDQQIITGSIDMLWQTEEGYVLIDFKTYSGTTETLFDRESDHYAGLYKGQLGAYRDAIEAAGLKVLDTLLYYPILGDIVRVY